MTAIQGLRTRASSLAAAMLCAAALAGCAADGSLIETASITPAPAPQTTASADPQCATLAQQIEQLRNEGTVGRLEKVAVGKSATAVVKRNALLQQTQLNKANADYIAKCGPNATRSAAAPAPVVTASAQPGASGVTIVAPKTAPAAPAATAPVATPKQ